MGAGGEPSLPSASSMTKASEKPKKGIVDKVKRVFSIKKKEKDGKSKADDGKPDPIPEASPATPKYIADVTIEQNTQTTERATPKPSASRAPKKPTGPPPPMLSPAERAQALFKKHGLDDLPSQWQLSTKVPQTERVHKEIRMRVHRNCHRCNTAFGASKTCLNCGHRRCKLCPRFPHKDHHHHHHHHKEKEGGKCEHKPIRRKKDDPADGLTRPPPCGTQDLVRKPILQRVHRTCHRCGTDFGSVKICPKCDHKRCLKCPRHPHKKHKPHGYYDGKDDSDSDSCHHPPKRTYKKVRQRIHWICIKCGAEFEPGCKICPKCGSQRDDTGRREPPKKHHHHHHPCKGKNPNKALPDIEQLEKRMMATSIA